MDRLSVMKAFCRIVERESFARAAEDIGVSPALLSRETRLLEESLGCTLLTRSTRSMSLTEHGRLYYEQARRLLGEIEGMEEAVRAGAGVIRGRLRVNAPLSFGLTVLSPMMPAFAERFPELEIALTLEDRVLDMIEGGFDLSIRIKTQLPDSSLIARRIAQVRQRLFASPDYLEKHGVPREPDDLAEHRHVSFMHSDEADSWTLSGPGGTENIPIAPGLRLGNSLFLRDMLIAGQGIGALPDFISDRGAAKGKLRRVLPEHELPTRHVYAVTASRRGADAKTLAFLDALGEALRQPG